MASCAPAAICYTSEMLASLGELNAATLIDEGHPSRALVLGRDGTGPDQALLNALRDSGQKRAATPATAGARQLLVRSPHHRGRSSRPLVIG